MHAKLYPWYSHGGQDLVTLARLYQTTQAQMDMITEIVDATRACPNLDTEQQSHFQAVCERLTTRYLGAMLSISEAACRLPARSQAELAAKAAIWVGRYVPEPDNDVLALAESICRDVASRASGWPES